MMIALLTVYAAQFVLAAYLTNRCLSRWARTSGCFRKIRKYWMIPFALFALLPVTGAFLPDSPAKFALQAAGNVWLGFYLYYGGTIVFFLIAALLLRKISAGRIARHWHGGILCLSLVMATALFAYGLVHAQHPVVVSFDVAVDKPAATEGEEMKLVLLGDLHLGVNSRLSTTQRVVELVNAEEPDVVVIAGDIFTSSYGGLAHPERYAEAFRKIRSKYGVYAVYGNHDVEETLLGGFPVSPISQAFRTTQMERFCEDCGFVMLTDETVDLPNGVILAGRIDGEKAGDGTTNRMTAAQLLEGADRGRPILVLQHEPKGFKDLAEAGADVALCGHTHAGQLFPGNLIVPLFNENAWGCKKLHGMETIVTAGVGYYGPPMRVGTDSEVTVIHMTFNALG